MFKSIRLLSLKEYGFILDLGEIMKEINQGKICPYCNKHTEFVDSSVIYGKSYGMIYLCRDCDAYVGCHKGTNIALGSLANSELRMLRNQAHALFDPMWKAKMKRDRCSKTEARKSGYKWLAQQMRIDRKITHIGMFDEEQCKLVIEICLPYYTSK